MRVDERVSDCQRGALTWINTLALADIALESLRTRRDIAL